MVRILGVNLPRRKSIEISLTYIFGIGRTTARKILASTGIPPGKKCLRLTNREINLLRRTISTEYKTEGELRRVYKFNIKRLVTIRSAKGRRHYAGLPVRGQRTRTNARTCKDKPQKIRSRS